MTSAAPTVYVLSDEDGDSDTELARVAPQMTQNQRRQQIRNVPSSSSVSAPMITRSASAAAATTMTPASPHAPSSTSPTSSTPYARGGTRNAPLVIGDEEESDRSTSSSPTSTASDDAVTVTSTASASAFRRKLPAKKHAQAHKHTNAHPNRNPQQSQSQSQNGQSAYPRALAPVRVDVSGPIWIPGGVPQQQQLQQPLSLHDEVAMFAQYIGATAEETEMRKDVVARVERVVHELWPSAQVVVFGSAASGLCLPTSDIDLTVNADVEYPGLPVLAEALARCGSFTSMERVFKAKVPLIKLRDVPTHVSIDISFNALNGPDNTRVVVGLLDQYPLARPLVLTLKYLLYQNALNEPYYGGVGSYTLVLMVVSFLQHRCKAAASVGLPPPSDLGELLLGFLRLYGSEFNYNRTGISVRDGGCYFPKAHRQGYLDYSRPYLLAVEDPADTENDVGHNSYDIMSVRALFDNAYRILAPYVPAALGGRNVPHHPRSRPPSLLSLIMSVHPQLQAYRIWTQAQYRAPDNGLSIVREPQIPQQPSYQQQQPQQKQQQKRKFNQQRQPQQSQ